jgi:hypothetical protein
MGLVGTLCVEMGRGSMLELDFGILSSATNLSPFRRVLISSLDAMISIADAKDLGSYK